MEGSRSSLQFQKQKARLSPPTYVQYSGPTHHQLHLIGKTKQNVGSYVHGTKTRATVKEHQGHLPDFNFVRSCDEHRKLLGLQAALWGRETSSPLQGWKLRLGARQPLQAGGSRPQLRQPRAQAQLSPPWDVCSSPADLSFPTRGPDSALGAPHPPCLRPPHAEPSAFSIPSSSPSIPPLLPFPWQPHPPLCHSVLCFHLFLSTFISSLMAVYSPNPPLSFASGLSLPFTLLLSPSMFSCHLRATFIYLWLKKKEEEKEKRKEGGQRNPISSTLASRVQCKPSFSQVTSPGQTQTNPGRNPLPATIETLS